MEQDVLLSKQWHMNKHIHLEALWYPPLVVMTDLEIKSKFYFQEQGETKWKTTSPVQDKTKIFKILNCPTKASLKMYSNATPESSYCSR